MNSEYFSQLKSSNANLLFYAIEQSDFLAVNVILVHILYFPSLFVFLDVVFLSVCIW